MPQCRDEIKRVHKAHTHLVVRIVKEWFLTRFCCYCFCCCSLFCYIVRIAILFLHRFVCYILHYISIDLVKAQKEAAKVPKCPLEVRASAADNAKGAAYFAERKEQIRQDLLKYGAVWFRGFDLMKSINGFRDMHQALELEPCLDPLHSSGLRKFASERDALYEEVRTVFGTIESNVPLFDLMRTMLGLPHSHSLISLISGQQTITSWTLHWITL